MDLDPSRLRHGEWIAAASAVLLLVLMLFVPWYGVSATGGTAAGSGRTTSYTGWTALTDLRWLLLVTIVAALALAYFQASQRPPAIPAAMSVIVTVLALITVLALLYRVVISVPGQLDQKAGAFLGLASSLGILYGGYASMRQEGTADRDGPQEIETVNLTGARGT